jgi:hypothetical protein
MTKTPTHNSINHTDNSSPAINLKSYFIPVRTFQPNSSHNRKPSSSQERKPKPDVSLNLSHRLTTKTNISNISNAKASVSSRTQSPDTSKHTPHHFEIKV